MEQRVRGRCCGEVVGEAKTRASARRWSTSSEVGPLSQWLHAGPVAAGPSAILIETRHVKAALQAMT
jgi:hypothetical protein